MPGGWWCCCDCPAFIDSFDRGDSDDPGPNWTEIDWDWDINSNHLIQTGGGAGTATAGGVAGALIVCTFGVSDERMIVSFTTIDEIANNKYRAVVNYLDPDNYMYCELGVGNWSTGAYISFNVVSAGVATEIDSFAVVLTGKTRAVAACLGVDNFSATISTSGADFCVSVPQGWSHATGVYGGLGNGASQPLIFDDFGVQAQWEANDKCSPCCPCQCQDKYLSMELLATYQGVGDCITLNGIHAHLNSHYSNLEWYGTVDLDTGTGTGTSGTCLEGLKLTLTCATDRNDVTTWQLEFDPSGMADPTKWCANTSSYYSTVDSICDPLNLVFHIGPIANPNPAICPAECSPCGRAGPAMPPPYLYTEYYIYITIADTTP